MTPELTIAIGFYIVFLLSVTAHEAAHALAALKLGDETAYLGGQVTLDPMPHIRREPIGMVVVPILSLVYIGWPLGFAHAPYDPIWAIRYPKRAAWMALAGPAANLILFAIAFATLKIGFSMEALRLPTSAEADWHSLLVGETPVMKSLAIFMSLLLVENLLLLLFNLIPFPPMDGSAALPLLVPEKSMRGIRNFMSQPYIPMMGLAAAWLIFPEIFAPIFRKVLEYLRA